MRREAYVSFLMGGPGTVKNWIAPVGRTLLSKALTGLSTDGRGCAPSLLVVRPEATPPCGPRALRGANDTLQGRHPGLLRRGPPELSRPDPRLRRRPSSSSRQFRFSLLLAPLSRGEA